MIFERDFLEFIELLNTHRVAYMVIGAHALAFHGRPRYTADLDIWIKPDFENATKMVRVLADFGFGAMGLVAEDFLKKNYVTQFGYPPLRIDILNAISGLNFNEAYERRVFGENGDRRISFINIGDFIANKRATGRAKDLGDIEALQSL